MKPDQFAEWLDTMKRAGLAKTDADCATALGVNKNSIGIFKRNGTNRRTALACRALLHRLEPFGVDPGNSY